MPIATKVPNRTTATREEAKAFWESIIVADVNAELNVEFEAELQAEIEAEIEAEAFAELDIEIETEEFTVVNAEIAAEIEAEIGAEAFAELDIEIETEEFEVPIIPASDPAFGIDTPLVKAFTVTGNIIGAIPANAEPVTSKFIEYSVAAESEHQTASISAPASTPVPYVPVFGIDAEAIANLESLIGLEVLADADNMSLDILVGSVNDIAEAFEKILDVPNDAIEIAEIVVVEEFAVINAEIAGEALAEADIEIEAEEFAVINAEIANEELEVPIIPAFDLAPAPATSIPAPASVPSPVPASDPAFGIDTPLVKAFTVTGNIIGAIPANAESVTSKSIEYSVTAESEHQTASASVPVSVPSPAPAFGIDKPLVKAFTVTGNIIGAIAANAEPVTSKSIEYSVVAERDNIRDVPVLGD